MQVLATHHVAIYTPNFETLEAFYTETLGFPVTLRWDDANIIFIDVGRTPWARESASTTWRSTSRMWTRPSGNFRIGA